MRCLASQNYINIDTFICQIVVWIYHQKMSALIVTYIGEFLVNSLTFALPMIISSKMIVFCKLRIWFLQKFNNFTNKKLDFFREIVCFICILLFANNFVCWKMQTIFVCEEFAKYTHELCAYVSSNFLLEKNICHKIYI